MATAPQGCPCPSMAHPQPQSLRGHPAWRGSHMVAAMPLLQSGSPTATVPQGSPLPGLGHLWPLSLRDIPAHCGSFTTTVPQECPCPEWVTHKHSPSGISSPPWPGVASARCLQTFMADHHFLMLVQAGTLRAFLTR